MEGGRSGVTAPDLAPVQPAELSAVAKAGVRADMGDAGLGARDRCSSVQVYPIYVPTAEVAPGLYRLDLFGFTERVRLLRAGDGTHAVRLEGMLGLAFLDGDCVLGPHRHEVPWDGPDVTDYRHRGDEGLSSLTYDVDVFEDGVPVEHIHIEYSGPKTGPLEPVVPPPIPVYPPPEIDGISPVEPEHGEPTPN
jgi:hypothetical protein